MHYPQLNAKEKQILMTSTFKGYNHNDVTDDGEMYDQTNLSSRSYPLMDQRPKRGSLTPASSQMYAISGRDQLIRCWNLSGYNVEYNWQNVGISLDYSESMLPKHFVHMGAYTCIWPDKVYFNTTDLSDCGSMERLLGITGTSVSLTMCRADGTDYDYTEITSADEAPSNPENGDLWMDTSGTNDVLMQYDAATEEWTEVASTYVKISGNSVGEGLSEYDTVQISSMYAPTTADSKVQEQVLALNNNMIVYGAGTNYLIVAGLLSEQVNALQAYTVRIDREVPDLDYVVESNNRIWGCFYGIQDGKAVNEIRACKLGDFKNWNCYMGLATDSYTASVGSDGPFTGAVTQKSYPVFFKENIIHRISGNTPSNFTITNTICRGVQDGSWRSAVVVNETVYYKSRTDVMAYDGSMPTGVSSQLGDVIYSDARAGAVNGKYYISMQNAAGAWSLFVYDTKLGIWNREDDLQVDYFGTVGDELYMLNTEDNTIYTANGIDAHFDVDEDEQLEWTAVFGLFGTDYRNKKYLSRFIIRMQLDEGATVQMYIQYDQDGTWQPHGGTITGSGNTGSFLIPVVPRRCDHLQLKLTGAGRCRIYALSRELEVGGDG